MGSVIPLKKSANSAYLELKNLVGAKLEEVENLVQIKLIMTSQEKCNSWNDLFGLQVLISVIRINMLINWKFMTLVEKYVDGQSRL